LKKLKKFEDTFVKHIKDIEAGKSSIEDCLDKYPSIREQLGPLLRINLEIRKRRGNGVEKVRGHTRPVY
jgi:hypothetical protein